MVIERDQFGNDISNLPKAGTYSPSAFESYSPISQVEPERTLGGTLKDVGVSLGKGVVGTGEAVVGLADLATPGNLGQAVENVGIDFEGAQEYLSQQYSPTQQRAFKKVDEAKGFLPTLGAMVQNPSTIGHAIIESAPSMVAGGVVGRGLGMAARGLGVTSKAIPLVTGAAGEGAITAGQMQENVRRQSGGDTTLLQQAQALGAGLGTSAFGVIGAKLGGALAKKFGTEITDIDTLMAGGKLGSSKDVAKRIVAGGISEGAFEELPQSIQEQVWTNAALGQPLDQDVGAAGAAGLLAGAVMGGGTNVFARPEITNNFTEEEQQILSDEHNNIVTAEQEATTPEEQANIQKIKEDYVDTVIQRQQENDLIKGISKTEEDIRSERQALYDQFWKLPVNKSAEESAQVILEQKPFTDVEQARIDRQRQIEQTYLPAEEEVDRINAYRLQEAQAAGEPTPVALRSTDLITRNGKPYQRREFLEGLLSERKDKDNYEIVEVPLNTTYQDTKNRLQTKLSEARNQAERNELLQQLYDLEFNIEDIKDQNQVGYIARLTDEALDPKRKENIWEDETGRYPSEASYWKAQQRALTQQQAQTAQRPYDRPIGPETQDTMVRQEQQRAIEQTLRDTELGPTQQIGESLVDSAEPLSTFKNERQVPSEEMIEQPIEQRPIETVENMQAGDVAEDLQARQDNIDAMQEELDANLIQQDQMDINDPRYNELQLDAEELRTNIHDARRELLVDRLAAGPKLEVREADEPGTGIDLPTIQKIYKGQEVFKAADGTVNIRLKNGRGINIQSVQDAGNGYIQMAIDTGQMSKAGKIFGVTAGANILLDENFADNATLWHENKHVLDNLGMITKADNSALNKEFTKLRKAGKLGFALSTHEDPMIAMEENMANTFAQVMLNREEYRTKPLGKTIQRIIDFFKQMLSFGKQTISGLAREVESGRIYERKSIEQNQDQAQFNTSETPEIKSLLNNFPNDQIKYDGEFDRSILNKPNIYQFTPQEGPLRGRTFTTEEMTVEAIKAKMASMMPQFQVVEDLTMPRQTIPQAQYDEVFNQKKDLLAGVKQVLRKSGSEIKLLADKFTGAISTRLNNINPMLRDKMRELDYRTTQKIVRQLQVALPIMKNAKKNMSPQDKSDWDWARKNSDAGKIDQLATKYGFKDQYDLLRDKLNKIRNDAEEVGYNIGFLEDYWPRVLNDREGFLKETQDLTKDPIFSQALEAQAKKMGIKVEELDDNLRADIISNLILGRNLGISGTGNMQARKFTQIDPKYDKFYMKSDEALMQYIYSMNKKIEARRFFGKVPANIQAIKIKNRNAKANLVKLQELDKLSGTNSNAEAIGILQDNIESYEQKLETYKNQYDFQENIGSYVDELMAAGLVDKSKEQELRDILDARFHERGTTGVVNAYKNLAYIDTMGSPLSAITQIGDLAWAYYIGGLTPKGIGRTTKNLVKAIFNQSNISKEDLGFERISQEFADADSLSRAVNKTFKWVGLEKLDSIGKETLINTSLDNYKNKAKQDPNKLKKEIRRIFGNKTDSVVNELLTNEVNTNPSDNVKYLVYSRVLDFHPAALSEMPEKYLNAGNGRVFYMLKSYTLKQMDVFRNEVWRNMKEAHKEKDPKKIIAGMQNMVSMGALLTLANAGADEIKDWLTGKEMKFEDHVIENLMTFGGASRYMRMKTRQEGIGTTLAQKILPPFKFLDSLSGDMFSDTSAGFRTVESVPGVGRLYYWHYGRGADKKKSIAEQDWAKIKKESTKFKKKLDAADDKRLFMQANIEDFRKSKQVDSLQGTISGMTATINKLKKLEQTPNVRKRIGQLEKQKELMLTKIMETIK